MRNCDQCGVRFDESLDIKRASPIKTLHFCSITCAQKNRIKELESDNNKLIAEMTELKVMFVVELGKIAGVVSKELKAVARRMGLE